MEATIKKAIVDVLAELAIPEIDFVVEHPSELVHGDYACNVAMVVAKQLGKNPREVAAIIVEKLAGRIKEVETLGVAGPGFINIHLTRSFFTKELSNAIHLGEDWGKTDTYAGKKVLVEYTDPNPFKEFHIGHLFTNSVGESISRLIEFSGADTKRLCYQGDVGMHVAKAVWGLKQHYGDDVPSKYKPAELGMAYAYGATEYKAGNPVVVEEIKKINKQIYEQSDEEINKIYTRGRESSLEYFKEIYSVLDTHFDKNFYESEAGPKGKELVLANPEVFKESNGARIFDGESYGLHTRVFINSEGLPTYEAKELALAKMKEDQLGTYDLSIIATANEVTEYFKVLKKAMSFVYPDLEKKTEHIGHGTVRLATGKMSSRTGDVISAVDFINEIADAVQEKMKETNPTLADDTLLARDIALGAIKYATLKGNILHDTIFDKDQALSFEGASGPYVQYTHARIHSVLRKAAEGGITPDLGNAPEEAYALERFLYQFPEVVAQAIVERAPHKVATFLTELASMSNSFYAAEKIADANDVYAPYKVALVQAVAQTLKNGLWLLGITAPKKM